MSENDLKKMAGALDNGLKKHDMIKKLEIAAKFLGIKIYIELDMAFQDKGKWDLENHDEKFNPHEKTGRHWQVDIWEKFGTDEWESYTDLMYECWSKLKDCKPFGIWLYTAPSEICFKCIIEVLENK